MASAHGSDNQDDEAYMPICPVCNIRQFIDEFDEFREHVKYCDGDLQLAGQSERPRERKHRWQLAYVIWNEDGTFRSACHMPKPNAKPKSRRHEKGRRRKVLSDLDEQEQQQRQATRSDNESDRPFHSDGEPSRSALAQADSSPDPQLSPQAKSAPKREGQAVPPSDKTAEQNGANITERRCKSVSANEDTNYLVNDTSSSQSTPATSSVSDSETGPMETSSRSGPVPKGAGLIPVLNENAAILVPASHLNQAAPAQSKDLRARNERQISLERSSALRSTPASPEPDRMEADSGASPQQSIERAARTAEVGTLPSQPVLVEDVTNRARPRITTDRPPVALAGPRKPLQAPSDATRIDRQSVAWRVREADGDGTQNGFDKVATQSSCEGSVAMDLDSTSPSTSKESPEQNASETMSQPRVSRGSVPPNLFSEHQLDEKELSVAKLLSSLPLTRIAPRTDTAQSRQAVQSISRPDSGLSEAHDHGSTHHGAASSLTDSADDGDDGLVRKVDGLVAKLRNPGDQNDEDLHENVTAAAQCLTEMQDEYFGIERSLRHEFGNPKPLKDPRKPVDSVTWEDQKEADLYGYEHDPSERRRGNQNPVEQRVRSGPGTSRVLRPLPSQNYTNETSQSENSEVEPIARPASRGNRSSREQAREGASRSRPARSNPSPFRRERADSHTSFEQPRGIGTPSRNRARISRLIDQDESSSEIPSSVKLSKQTSGSPATTSSRPITGSAQSWPLRPSPVLINEPWRCFRTEADVTSTLPIPHPPYLLCRVPNPNRSSKVAEELCKQMQIIPTHIRADMTGFFLFFEDSDRGRAQAEACYKQGYTNLGIRKMTVYLKMEGEEAWGRRKHRLATTRQAEDDQGLFVPETVPRPPPAPSQDRQQAQLSVPAPHSAPGYHPAPSFVPLGQRAEAVNMNVQDYSSRSVQAAGGRHDIQTIPTAASHHPGGPSRAPIDAGERTGPPMPHPPQSLDGVTEQVPQSKLRALLPQPTMLPQRPISVPFYPGPHLYAQPYAQPSQNPILYPHPPAFLPLPPPQPLQPPAEPLAPLSAIPSPFLAATDQRAPPPKSMPPTDQRPAPRVKDHFWPGRHELGQLTSPRLTKASYHPAANAPGAIGPYDSRSDTSSAGGNLGIRPLYSASTQTASLTPLYPPHAPQPQSSSAIYNHPIVMTPWPAIAHPSQPPTQSPITRAPVAPMMIPSPQIAQLPQRPLESPRAPEYVALPNSRPLSATRSKPRPLDRPEDRPTQHREDPQRSFKSLADEHQMKQSSGREFDFVQRSSGVSRPRSPKRHKFGTGEPRRSTSLSSTRADRDDRSPPRGKREDPWSSDSRSRPRDHERTGSGHKLTPASQWTSINGRPMMRFGPPEARSTENRAAGSFGEANEARWASGSLAGLTGGQTPRDDPNMIPISPSKARRPASPDARRNSAEGGKVEFQASSNASRQRRSSLTSQSGSPLPDSLYGNNAEQDREEMEQAERRVEDIMLVSKTLDVGSAW